MLQNLLLSFIIVLLLSSCDDNDRSLPVNIPSGTITCDIEGVYNFKFESNNITINRQVDSVIRFFNVSGRMDAGGNSYFVTASAPGDMDVADNFQIRQGLQTIENYDSRFYGIREDELVITDSSISATFSFNALKATEFNQAGVPVSFDTVYVKNGKLIYRL